MFTTRHHRSFLVGMVAGGLATYAMDYVMKRMKQPDQDQPPTENDEVQSISLIGKHYRKGETSTAALGRILYTKIYDQEPDDATKKTLSQIVHVAYGSLQGGIFAMIAHLLPGRYPNKGAFYGFLMWLLGDEIMVPLLGLSKSPHSFSKKQHEHYLKGHLLYGSILGALVLLLSEDSSLQSDGIT